MTLPYTFEIKTAQPDGIKFAVMKTELSRVKPEIINTQMLQKPHIGINGGFFSSDNGYNNPPTGLRSISYWYNDEESYSYNGTSDNQLSRKTFVSYTDSNNTLKATHIYAGSLSDVLANYPTARAVIGGNDYNRSSWGSGLIVPAYDLAAWRTVLAWDDTHGYFIVTHGNSVKVSNLKFYLGLIDIDPVNSVVLDGSGSTAMRVAIDDTVHWYGSPTHNRYIGNMVRVYGIDWFI